ncbi:MAG: cyclic nucleotide-binding domain-containing protein [Pseudomonadota bacterium]
MALDLSEEDIAALEERAEVRSFAIGDTLIQEGHPIQSLFLIRSGTVEVTRMLRGKQVSLATCTAGEVFGEIGFLDGNPATATVTAVEPVRALEINRIRMSVYLRMDDQIAKTFYRFLCHILASRLRDLSAKMPDLLVT